MKTKKLKFMATVGLVVLFLISGVMTVVTAAQEASRLTAVITTDKDSYIEGETAVLQLTVTNGYDCSLDQVTARIELPEEMTVQKGSLTGEAFSLEAGESKTQQLTVSVNESADVPASVDETTKDGGNGWIVWTVLAALAGAAVVAVILKGKHKKKIMSLFLCFMILLTTVPIPVSAADLFAPSGSVTVEKNVTINGNARSIIATVAYNEDADSEKTSSAGKVTLTFQSFEGTPVEAITVEAGEAPGRLPQSYQAGKAFMGWYSDVELTRPFYADTVVNGDMELYASFTDVDDEVKIAESLTYYEEDCDGSMPITLLCAEEITAENLNRYMTLYAFTGEVPSEFTVTKSGEHAYTVVPVTPYSAGCLYRMAVPEDVCFQGLEESVKEYSFRIYKEYSETVALDDGIKYVDRKQFAETEMKYKYQVSKNYVEKMQLAKEDTLCIGDGTQNYNEDILFVNVVLVEENENGYYLYCEDSDIEDVFDDVDVYFTESLENEYLKEGFDPDSLVAELYDSKGVEQLNMLLAAALAESPAVTEELGGISLLAVDNSMLDFSDYASLDKSREYKGIIVELEDMLTIKVEIGSAVNDNFQIPDPEKWTVLTFTLNWNGTIKDKLKIDATFTIAEYMNVSLQGYKATEFKWFDLPQLEFDYAANIYSQTDLGVKVLICSVDESVEPGEEDYKDISDDIEGLFSSEEENDTEGLVAEVQKMLEDQGDYIELCEIPFFTAKKPLAVFSLDLQFSFVIKVNFAAGMSSKFSVLDATQVGARGNSKDGSFGMYKNKLAEGDRYSFDLSVCGYLGIKAGVRGSLTVSFLGIERLGKVGVSVEVGAYLDMYGYAQYHIVKPSFKTSTVYSTLIGGFYMEAGIYLEVNLIAKSDVFKVTAEVSLVDEKWPLFTMGNKELLISLNDLETPILIESKGTTEGILYMKDAPALTGRALNLTTGEINEEAVIPWDSVTMRFSDKNFSTSVDGGYIKYQRPLTDGSRDNSAECTAELYYKGQNLQFTKKASSTNTSTAKTATVIWYDSTKADKDALGTICTANFYLEHEGEKILLGSREVLAGNYVGKCYYDEMGQTKYTDGIWDKDPYETAINADTDFIYSVKTTQARVVFVYFDDTTKQWTAEMLVADVGKLPEIKEKYENEHMSVVGWSVAEGRGIDHDKWFKVTDANGQRSVYRKSQYGYGTQYYAADALPVIDTELEETAVLTDRTPGEVICTTAAESADAALSNMMNLYYDEYAETAYVYTPSYDYEELTVTVATADANGETVYSTDKVQYGESYRLSSISYPYWLSFQGLSVDGGTTLYNWLEASPRLYADTLIEAVYETITHNVTLQYYDDTTGEYKDYKTYAIRRGETVPQEYFDEAENACVWLDGTTHKTYGWIRKDSSAGATNAVFADCVMRLSLSRSVRISLDAGEGELLFDDYIQSFDTEKYQVKVGMLAGKAADAYNEYELTGWRNETTGEVYGVNEEVTLNTAVTLTAVYTATPKTYRAEISTPYGTLLNGQKTDSYVGDYDGYRAFMEKYENYTPGSVAGAGYTMVYRGSQYQENGLSVTLSYAYWDRITDEYTIRLNAGEGILNGVQSKTAEYGVQIKLSDMASPYRTDPSRVYTFSHWVDGAGNTYQPEETVTLTENLSLTAVWTAGAYKEYTITFQLDGKVMDTSTYHYGDTLPTFGAPEEASGYEFSGWDWSGSSSGALLAQPTAMPAENLTATGSTTPYYLSYEFDGSVYKAREAVKAGSTVTLLAKPEIEGYDVSDWAAEGLTITGSTFVMPAQDVVLKATSTLATYKVTILVDGKEASGSPLYQQYGSEVVLPKAEERDGYLAYWSCAEVSIYKENGTYTFYMPAKDVTVSCNYTKDAHSIYFMVDGESTPVDVEEPVAVGEQKEAYHESLEREGWIFSETWFSKNLGLCNSDSTFTMPDEDVYLYVRGMQGDWETECFHVTLEVYYDGVQETDGYYISFLAACGETVSLGFYRDGYTLSRYESDEATVSGSSVTMPTDTEEGDSVTLKAYFTKKSAEEPEPEQYYLSYEFDGKEYKAEEAVKAGSTVTLLAKPTKEGHTVSDWTADGLTITGTTFVMPERDVVLKATSTPVTCTVTIQVDGSATSDSPKNVQYGSKVTLPAVEDRDGYTYQWSSEEVTITEENGTYTFCMPAKDVTVSCKYTQKTYSIYFMVDGESTPFAVEKGITAGTQKDAYHELPEREGWIFSGTWFSKNLGLLKSDSISFTMPKEDVYLYVRGIQCDSETETWFYVTLEIYYDGETRGDSGISFVAACGETVSLGFYRDGYTLSRYESDEATVSGSSVTMPANTEGGDSVTLKAYFTSNTEA